MSNFAVGDHVRWNSEARSVTGVITKRHTHNVEYKGYVRQCTEQDPQCEVMSDKTEHVAMHKTSAMATME